MKKFTFSLFLFGFFGLLSLTGSQLQAQTVLYYQNFDSSSALPSGWVSTYNDTVVTQLNETNGWYVDTTGGNGSTGYPGASDSNNIVIKDIFPAGTYELITNNINTSLDSNIQAIWGTRVSNKFFSNGGAIQGFYYSNNNGTTWDSLPYTEGVANSSAWFLDNDSMPISLPASANFQATLKFKWVAVITSGSSGTYRIDDFTVTGIVDSARLDTVHAGITTIDQAKPSAYVYVAGNSNINIVAKNIADEKYTVEVIDVLGETMERQVMASSVLSINCSNFAAGVYLVRVSNGSSSIVTKVALVR